MYCRDAVDEMTVDTPMTRLVLLEAELHADRGGVLRMSQSELATHAGVSPRMVAKAFAALQARGLLSRQGHGRYKVTPNGPTDDGAPLVAQMADWAADRLVQRGGKEVGHHKMIEGLAQEFGAQPGDLIMVDVVGLLLKTRRMVERAEPVETEEGIRYRVHYRAPDHLLRRRRQNGRSSNGSSSLSLVGES